ncbi:ribonuclease E activity regulator RraA [Lipingzhangella sp. LS1_29]|uniref:4-hydroxy-4-methyl-2-oxoglutarate aldolase n=1 Tax=Lipingzhangella rawalii TaxID=2055835 RepID=A0ABU2H109_9ACTN|nr:ribonuclease E activity regulator RraA [Lipingzhangella rawalii]MDS1268990.1 ribonuclease E activity regulator RraA [Lipingzhangella rawalii]
MTETTDSPSNHATADLIDAHGSEIDSCHTQFRQFGRHRSFCGPVRTVRCHEDNGLVKEILNSAGHGAVLVVDGGGSVRSALLGDLIAAAAVDNGWSGVVIHGAVRDSATLETLDLGVKALGTNPRKSDKDGAGRVDVPVTFGGVTFNPGQWLYSDEDGIVVSATQL